MLKKGLLLLGMVMIMACSFNQPDIPSWDTSWKLYLPVQKVNLDKIINDSTLVADTTGAHHTIKFKLQDSTDWVRVEQADLSIGSFSQNFQAKIGSIKLTDVADVTSPSFKLDELLPPELLSSDTIPPYPDRTISPDGDSVTYDFYESAHIKKGTMYLTFHNESFLSFKPGMKIEIYDNGVTPMVKIAEILYPDTVRPYSVVRSNEVDLSNLDITNEFLLKYTMPIQGSDTITVLDEAMRNSECYTVLSLKGIEVSEARAKIPEQTFSKDENIGLPQDEHKLIEAEIASGTINLDITNNSNVHANLHVVLPDIIQDNAPKTVDINLLPQQRLITPVDLAGSIFRNSKDPGQVIDSIQVEITATVGSDDAVVDITENDGLGVTFSSSPIYFKKISGILAPVVQDIDPQSMDLSDMFKNVKGTGLNLDDLRLALTFENQIDIPIRMHLKIGGYHEDGGLTDSVIMVIDTTIQASSVTPVSRFIFDKNATDPSIVDLIAILPTRITISGNVVIEGEGSVQVNDGVRSKFLIESPLAYRLTDTLQYKSDIDSLGKDDIDQDMRDRLTDDLSQLTLHLNVINRTPLGSEVRLIMAADSNLLATPNIADSTRKMVITAHIAAAQVDADGYVQTPTQNEVLVKITHTQAQLFNYSPIYLQQTVMLLPTGGEKVVIQTDDGIDLDAYIGLKFRVDLNK